MAPRSLLLSLTIHVVVTIPVNTDKPEAHGPFHVYHVTGMKGAEEGKEVDGYYILFSLDHRYELIQPDMEWCTAAVSSSGEHIMFKVPGWSFALWPEGSLSRGVYNMLMPQLPESVQKSINHTHSMFDEAGSGVGLESFQSGSKDSLTPMEKESRKWIYYILDFSSCKKKKGPLSSKLVFKDATDKELLDYDLISVPLVWEQQEKKDVRVIQEETILGFRVGIDAGAKKTKRTAPGMSSLAQKRQQKKDANKVKMNLG